MKSNLFDNVVLHHRLLRNRLVVAPMTRRSAAADGTPTTKMETYYRAFAKGGFSLIITEGTYTDDLYSKSDNNQPGIVTEQHRQGWQKVVDKVHACSAIFICQLMHSGALSQYSEHTIGPSAVQPIGERTTEPGGITGPFPLPREMSQKDFATVKEGFVNAATQAYKAGFDGVEIHAANGYLFDQFITEHTNLRTDEYGGNVYNRLRFLIEVFTAIKEALPAEFIIGIRLSESKVNYLRYRWPGGAQTPRAIFDVLKNLNASYYHIAAEGGNWARECLYPDGSSSTGIAKSLTNVPIIANGGLHDKELAESLVRTNQANFISIGRAAIANPNWPKLIAAGVTPIPFFKGLIKPSLTLQHTQAVLQRYKSQQVELK